MAIHCILQQDNLSHCCAKQNPQAAMAFLTQSHSKVHTTCTYYKWTGHLTAYCIQPSSKMAEWSIDDTHTAFYEKAIKDGMVRCKG